MQVIPPIEITDAKFTSSTVSEPSSGETAWSGSSVSYVVGDERIRTTTHRTYRCIVAHTSAASPTPENNSTQWEEIGPTNKWAMFDFARNTATTAPLTFAAVFAPGQRVNSFALSGISANSYSLTVTSVTGGGTVYTASGSLNTRETLTWFDYFFGEFGTQESVVFFDIPPYSDAIFTVTLTATSGNASLGACVVGTYVYLGATQYDAVSDVLNFSSIDRDDDGKATLTARRNVPKTSQVVLCDKARVNKVRQLRDDLNATPAIWYGINDELDGYFESLSILGIYKEFSINVSYPEHAVINLTLEEI